MIIGVFTTAIIHLKMPVCNILFKMENKPEMHIIAYGNDNKGQKTSEMVFKYSQ